MSVVRVVKNNQYTVIHNSPLQDTRLSLKARGLIAYCFSLPENWSYSIEGLVKAIGSDGRDSIRAGLKELENCGYLKRRRLHDAKGKFTDTQYIIYETAQLVEKQENTNFNAPVETEKPTTQNPTLVDFQGSKPITQNPTLDNPTLEKPTSENRLQQSKYKQNKYKTTTKENEDKDKDKKEKEPHTEHDAALPDEINNLAKRCRVSEKTARGAYKKFGAEMLKRYLVYMDKQQGIQNPNAWLMQALRECWDIDCPTNREPSPQCPECKGVGYTIVYYDDPQTETRQEMKLYCSKCRSS